MSTRSRIGILRKDGSIDSIYCHLDGYPEGVGIELHEHYRDRTKVNNLIDLGDISHLEKYLNPDPNKIHEFGYDTEQPNVVVAYHRDRGEKLNKLHSKGMKEFNDYCLKSDQEYAYLYNPENRDWKVADIPFRYEEGYQLEFMDLKDRLKKFDKLNNDEIDFSDLVWKIVDYEKHNDHYEFMDTYGSDEEGYESLKDYFLKNGFEEYILSLNDNLTYLEEDKDDAELGKLYKHTEEILNDIMKYEKLDDLEI